MRKLIYFFIGIFIISCNLEEKEQAFEDLNQEMSNKFFENDTADPNLEYMITYLKTINCDTPFIEEIINAYGQPKWEIYNKEICDDATYFTIPIIKKADKKVNYFYVFQQKRDSVFIAIISRNSNLEILNGFEWRFDQFTQKIFGPQKDYYFYEELIKKESKDGIQYAQTNVSTCDYVDWYVNGVYTHTQTLSCRGGGGDGENRGSWNLRNANTTNFSNDENGGHYGNGENDTSDSPTIIDLFLEEIANCVNEKLWNSSTEGEALLSRLLDAFKDVDGSISELNMVIRAKPLEDDDYNGVTNYTNRDGNNNVYITINSNNLDRKPLEIARTFLHEGFHAYIIACAYADNPDELGGDENFLETWQKFKEKCKENNIQGTAHHNWMAEKYISYMKDGLRDFFAPDASRFKTSMGWDNDKLELMYECLAWKGLENTDAWTNNTNKLTSASLDNFRKLLPLTCK